MRLFLYEHITATVADPSSSLFLEGRAMRDALAEDLRRIDDVELVEFDPALGFDGCLERADVAWVIAPEFDHILIDFAQRVEHSGRTLIGPTSAAIRLASDKLMLHDHWKRHGLPTPETRRADRFPEWTWDLPWIVKPIDGAGSTATTIVRNVRDWPGAIRRGTEAGFTSDRLIVQPWHSGTACSVSLIHGQPLQPMIQVLEGDNELAYVGGRYEADWASDRLIPMAMQAISSVPGLQGYVGVDLIDAGDPSGPVAIEINPRLTTSYVGLRLMTDENLAERVLFADRFDAAVAWKSVFHLHFDSAGRGQIHEKPDGGGKAF
jgi:predicted ATP-grasp superfamily ATP-dependent carboligase